MLLTIQGLSFHSVVHRLIHTCRYEVFYINQIWFSKSLLLAFYQATFLFQLIQHLYRFLFCAAKRAFNLVYGKNDIYTPSFIEPAVFCREIHPIQKYAIQQFCVCGYIPKSFVSKQNLWDSVKRKHIGLLTVKIIKLHSGIPPFHLLFYKSYFSHYLFGTPAYAGMNTTIRASITFGFKHFFFSNQVIAIFYAKTTALFISFPKITMPTVLLLVQ